MFFTNEKEMQTYADCMDALKRLNRDYYILRKSNSYKVGMVITMTKEMVKHGDIKRLRTNYSRWFLGRKSSRQLKTPEHDFPLRKLKPDMYFSNARIAVYTAIFGKYDGILEPTLTPDNIDYYVITDQNVDLSKSAWNKVDIKAFEKQISKMNNIEKNRYFKMMPHLVFRDYEYSIYIDGNIQVVTDLTEFVNYIGKYDIATHQHFCRDCVYDECEAILSAKKDSVANIEKHKELYLKTNMPLHYGLMECNILARRHTELCKNIMESWWDEFLEYSNRDQLSLPHVLFMANIPVAEVATLGANVFLNPSIRVVTHN